MKALFWSLVFLLLWAFTPSTTARAEISFTIPIAMTNYPDGSEATIVPSMSNYHMDCLWNFNSCPDSGGSPFMHTVGQDALGRTGGWAQNVDLLIPGKPNKDIRFQLFYSAYPTAVQAANAVRDLSSASAAMGFGVGGGKGIPVANGDGVATESFLHLSGLNVYLIGVQQGTIDIEATGFNFNKKLNGEVKKYLGLQVAAAIAMSANP